jgi:hypothetical protein
VKGAAPAAVAAGVAGLLALTSTPVAADSFTPVTLAITVAPVARLHQPLKITVAVSADAGVLDTRTAPLRIRVKLATECGGAYAYTPGTLLLDRVLSPQPATGQPYTAQATGSGRPRSYGVQTVCVFLEEEGDDRQFATDTSNQVDVSKPCTVRAGRYDAARRALARARRELRGARTGTTRARLGRLVAKRAATAKAGRRAALKACGQGVVL